MSNHGSPIIAQFVSDDPSDLSLETQALIFDYLGGKVHSRKAEGQHGLIHGIQGKKGVGRTNAYQRVIESSRDRTFIGDRCVLRFLSCELAQTGPQQDLLF